MQDDDTFSPLKLSKINEIHKADPSIDIFTNGFDIVDQGGEILDVNFFRRQRDIPGQTNIIKDKSGLIQARSIRSPQFTV